MGKNKAFLFPDPVLSGICLLLVLMGIFILSSVSASFSEMNTGNPFFYLTHQVVKGLIPGILLGGIAFMIPLRLFRTYALYGLVGTVILMLCVFLPGIGGSAGGASRWIFLGPLSFQPSELLKLMFIVYLASWLASQHKNEPKKIGKKQRGSASGDMRNAFIPFLAIIGLVSVLLVAQPDIGTLGVIALTSMAMYFLAATPLWHTLVLMGLGIGSLALLIKFEPYRMSRFLVFLHPSLDPLGQGYQVKQALIGIGSGGIFGAGLGMSVQKFGLLPEPISDSIFAVFSEEAGFVGGIFLLSLFLAFAWRGFSVSRKAPDMFSSLVAAGITLWILIQAMVNIGAMIGILPLTGIPLPFVSYGGSALVTELIGLGILLNISKHTTT